MRLLADLSWRLHAHIREIETLTFENAKNRVANHLLHLAGNGGGGTLLTLNEAKHDLAARLGIKPETPSRTLRSMTEGGIIQVEGQHIRILDMARLRQPA